MIKESDRVSQRICVWFSILAGND